MQRSKNRLLLLGFMIILLSSCGTSKRLGKAEKDYNSPDYLLKNLITNQVSADWFSARAKINFQDEYTAVGASATIRMKKDSAVWVSVKKLGFEVGRALITQDSVYIIDRLNNTYDIRDLHYLEKTYNIPANLDIVQAILLGNPVFFSTKDFQSKQEELAYHLFGKDEKMESHYWLGKKNLELHKMSFDDMRQNRKIHLKLEDYQQLQQNQKFSYFRILEMNSQETGNIKVEIKFSQLELNSPKDISFEIPKRYARAAYND